MNRAKKFFSIMTAALIFSTAASFVACNDSEEQGETVTVTYDYNYEGAAAPHSTDIEKSDVAVEPEAPERDRYRFTAWYADEACTKKFDFEEALYEDVTIYAGWEQTVALVTFDYNYDTAKTEQRVNIGQTVSQPADPAREGHLFTSWYTDSACTEGKQYDFTSAVTADMTLYSGWEAVSGDVVTITYMWNYEGAENNGVCNKSTVQKNKKTTAYQATREGHYLVGWYTDGNCTEKFDFGKRITDNLTLYAKWFDIYTFEAEFVDVTGVPGSTYSGGSGGKSLVWRDEFDLNASGGFYITDLYKPQTGITFEITSDKAVTDAVLVLRLGAEYFDVTLTPDMFAVKVNDAAISYSAIVLDNVPNYTTGKKRAFQDYTISTKVSLQAGTNTVKLIVNNDTKMSDSGTLDATAPMIDCLYLYTDAALSWEPHRENLDNK